MNDAPLVADGARLECERYGALDAAGPRLVFLHEGLGCVEMWRGFPARVARETGLAAIAYSRRGYGRSDGVAVPRPLTYMHDEALRSLPEVLDAVRADAAILVGHSDGGSIALIHAAAARDRERVRGLVLLAPHVFCEDVSVESIERAKEAFEHGGLRAKLERYHHANTDCAFWGWNRAWLDPEFKRSWNLEGLLPEVHVPVLALQGARDPYGTLAQIDAIERGVSGPFERRILPGVGHDPAREAPDVCASAIAGFIARWARESPETTAP